MADSLRLDRPRRDLSLDAFRGVSVIAMIAGNFLAAKAITPAWLKHAPDIGLTVADIVAPFFVVAMAASFRLSAARRQARPGSQSEKAAFRKSFVLPPDWRSPLAWRAWGLVGLGGIISAGHGLVMPEGGFIDWGVLQALGVAEFVLLYVAGWPIWVRALLALASLAVYQSLLPLTAPLVLSHLHGGLIGAVDWIALILLADCALERLPRIRSQFLAGLILTGLGWALSGALVLSKNRVSPDYVLLCLGLSLLALAIARAWYLLGTARTDPVRGLAGTLRMPIRLFGAHPLGLYLGHELFLALFYFSPWPWWGRDSSLGLSLVQLAALYALLTGLALLLEWRRPTLHVSM